MASPTPTLVSLVFLSILLSSLTNAFPLPDAAPDPAAKPVKIALLHMYDSVSFFARLGNLSGVNKLRYAKRHGYDMIFSTPLKTSGILEPIDCKLQSSDPITGPDANGKCWAEDKQFDIDHTRAPTFGKIKLAVAACQGRENGWLLWSDADALIVNQTMPLEAIIDDGFDLMIAYDWLMMNAGMLLMKCSQWTIDFLTNIYATRKFDAARALDQSGFQEFLDNLTVTEKRDHVKVVPKYAINVYTEEYRPGDFLLHMAGKLYEATEPGLFAIANQFDILSMVDDIEDVKAFFRGRHLLNYYSGTCKVKRGQRQSSCKPGDPRRILLNESLLSMSYPNRYRHVGLRYYWLGNWKDKYDDPSWNRKRRTLPTPLRLDPNLPPVPRPALHHVEEHLDDAALSAGQEGKVHEPPGKHEALHKEEHSKDEVPEVDHDADVKLAKELKKRGGAVAHDRDDDDDDDDDGGWPFYVWVILLSLIGATAAALGIVYKRRRKMSTKIQ